MRSYSKVVETDACKVTVTYSSDADFETFLREAAIVLKEPDLPQRWPPIEWPPIDTRTEIKT